MIVVHSSNAVYFNANILNPDVAANGTQDNPYYTIEEKTKE
ncbi:MAG: hypothetical protein ACJ71K_00555 [Nitrososphaeraceae archaeon]|jgi:hypothetical protein